MNHVNVSPTDGFNSHRGQSFSLSLCGPISISRANAHSDTTDVSALAPGILIKRFVVYDDNGISFQKKKTVVLSRVGV